MVIVRGMLKRVGVWMKIVRVDKVKFTSTYMDLVSMATFDSSKTNLLRLWSAAMVRLTTIARTLIALSEFAT